MRECRLHVVGGCSGGGCHGEPFAEERRVVAESETFTEEPFAGTCRDALCPGCDLLVGVSVADHAEEVVAGGADLALVVHTGEGEGDCRDREASAVLRHEDFRGVGGFETDDGLDVESIEEEPEEDYEGGTCLGDAFAEPALCGGIVGLPGDAPVGEEPCQAACQLAGFFLCVQFDGYRCFRLHVEVPDLFAETDECFGYWVVVGYEPHSHCAAEGAPQAFDALVGDGRAVATDGPVGECGTVADDEGGGLCEPHVDVLTVAVVAQ